jgi:hypothetical protein
VVVVGEVVNGRGDARGTAYMYLRPRAKALHMDAGKQCRPDSNVPFILGPARRRSGCAAHATNVRVPSLPPPPLDSPLLREPRDVLFGLEFARAPPAGTRRQGGSPVGAARCSASRRVGARLFWVLGALSLFPRPPMRAGSNVARAWADRDVGARLLEANAAAPPRLDQCA